MEETVFYRMIRHIHERLEVQTEYIMSGGARNYEEYTRAIARCTELRELEEVVKDMESRYIDQ